MPSTIILSSGVLYVKWLAWLVPRLLFLSTPLKRGCPPCPAGGLPTTEPHKRPGASKRPAFFHQLPAPAVIVHLPAKIIPDRLELPPLPLPAQVIRPKEQEES